MNLPLHQLITEAPVELLHYSIDASRSILAAASPVGSKQSRLHSLNPPHPLGRPLAYDESGLRVVLPYDGSSNILFLLPCGGEKLSRIVQVWDDTAQEVAIELEHREEVLGVQCRRDKLVIVLRRKVLLYHVDFSLDRQDAVVKETEYETCDNPLGLASIATSTGSFHLALPGRQIGQVQLIRLPPLPPRSAGVGKPSPSLFPIVHIFLAHSSPLQTLNLTASGSLLATSSNKGTLLRVFSTQSKSLARELRRGTDNADIWSVCFSDQDKGGKLACTSDKGTVHVWILGDLTNTSSIPSNDKGKGSSRERTVSSGERDKGLNILKPYLPTYFSSTWSDLHWRIPASMALNGTAATPEDDIAICAFLPASPEVGAYEQDQLVLVTRSGAWFRLSTTASDPQEVPSSKRGDAKPEKRCKMLEYRRLIERYSMAETGDYGQ